MENLHTAIKPYQRKCYLETTLLYNSVGGWVKVTVGKDRLKLMLNRLDEIRLEPLRLRAILLAEEALDEREKRELEDAREEITQGFGVNLEELIKEKGTGVYWNGVIIETESLQGDVRYAS